MTDAEENAVRELITGLCNRAVGALPKGSSVTMAVRLPVTDGDRDEFVITNEKDTLAVIAILLKLMPGDHPDVTSDIKVPIEPTGDKWDACLPGCLKPVYRGPITHASGCPNYEEP